MKTRSARLLLYAMFVAACCMATVFMGCTKHKVDPIALPYVEMNVMASGDFRTMDFCDASHGIAIRNTNEVFVTSDGGNTWTATVTMNNHQCNGLQYVSPDTAYILWDNTSLQDMLLYRSSDGGITWDSLYDFQCYQADMNFYNGQHGFLTRYNSGYELLGSNDAGATWNVVSAGTEIYRPVFLDQNNGFARGGGYNIRRTDDYGTNWTNVLPANQAYNFVIEKSSNKIFAVGSGGKIRRSDDSGNSWTNCFTDATLNLRIIDVHSSGVVVAGEEGVIAVSRDFGNNWEYCEFRNVNDMRGLYYYTFQITGPNTILFCASDYGDRFIGKITLP